MFSSLLIGNRGPITVFIFKFSCFRLATLYWLLRNVVIIVVIVVVLPPLQEEKRIGFLRRGVTTAAEEEEEEEVDVDLVLKTR